MDKNEEKLLRSLSGEFSHGKQGSCPSLEDISALIDGALQNEARDNIQSHIASCNVCYDTYLTASELSKSSINTSYRIFSPMAIAATIFIALASFVIYYKVNVSVKDEISHIVVTDKNPLVLKENLPEIKKDKKRVISPAPMKIAKTKFEKPRGLKRSASEKKKSRETAYVEEFHQEREEPAGRIIRRRSEPGNVQGISQSLNEPVKSPLVVSASVGVTESADEVQAQKVVLRQKKGGKGIVDSFLEDEEKSEGKSNSVNCFRKTGDEYIRDKRFSSLLPFEKFPPEVLEKIQPGDMTRLKKKLSPETFTLEITTDREGNILKLCLLEGDEMNAREIIAAVRSWKFMLPGSSPVRFRIILGLTHEGLLQILNKK